VSVVHRFERQRRILFSHCDPAGIVFYPQYLVMINDLVETWVGDALGLPYAEMIKGRRIGLPTVSLQCEFEAPSHLGDEVTMGLTVLRVGTRSITLHVGCRLGDEQRMDVRQVLVFTDLDSHRSIDIPADLRAGIERFFHAA
jgi:4-hydroxybenzoyl-CoA thioesterase